MHVFIIGISEGRFRFVADKQEIGTCLLEAEPLTALFRAGKLSLKGEDEVLMYSSSIDFPEDDGAPEGFNPRPVIEAALLALLPEKRRGVP